MTCTCGNAVPDLTAHLGFCSSACLDAEVFWHRIRDDVAHLLGEPCMRCLDGPVCADSDALCRQCLDLVSHEREVARQESLTDALTEDGTDGGKWTA